ncbi:MAG: hypothetical protein ACOCP8_01980 [archaeon]
MYLYKYQKHYFIKVKNDYLGFASIKTLCDISGLSFKDFKNKINNQFKFKITKNNEIYFKEKEEGQKFIDWTQSYKLMNILDNNKKYELYCDYCTNKFIMTLKDIKYYNYEITCNCCGKIMAVQLYNDQPIIILK